MARFVIFFGSSALLLFLIIEPYLYRTIKRTYVGSKRYRLVKISFFLILLLSIIAMITMILYYVKGYAKFDLYGNLAAGYFFANGISKLFLFFVLLAIDSGLFIKKLVVKTPASSRRSFLRKTALISALIPFSSLIYGTLKGRYQFRVFQKNLTFSDLPEEFHGLKIVQISDVHTGSWDDIEPMKEGLELLKSQKPDIILLTGDLVNNIAMEAEPYIDIFKSLEAPLGKFAVMGNHDYGVHYHWKTESERLENIKAVKKQYEKMGFQMLNNESVPITKNEKSIRLVGVENWGLPPFPQVGDLDLALKNVDENDFKILLSHDPDHWEHHTLKHPFKVHLTLSGHTHGSQMGVEIPGFKFSPVQFRYKRWADLYHEQDQYLYVNRGFGYIGYPGRVGIWPEIGILTLKSNII